MVVKEDGNWALAQNYLCKRETSLFYTVSH